MRHTTLLLSIAFLAGLSGSALAVPITYTLSDGTFDGGGTLSGTITIDDSDGKLNGTLTAVIGGTTYKFSDAGTFESFSAYSFTAFGDGKSEISSESTFQERPRPSAGVCVTRQRPAKA
jgi:hypothetical protein